MTEINLDSVRKVYEGDSEEIVAVEDMDITIKDNEFVVLVGPSGCGKSTTLRTIAGLEDVTEGSIRFDDTDVTNIRARNRDVAMVFQNYALYPTMTAKENMSFGLRLSSELTTEEINEKVENVAKMMGIGDILQKEPGDLSGGQQQRVALGRAIVRDPNVFLMDEPLSNLDAKRRASMRTELQELQDRLGVTTVYVTHDQEEAMALGDRIAVLNKGELQQIGEPEELYLHPTNEFVADFLGSPSINLFDVTVDGDKLRGPGDFVFQLKDPSPVEDYKRVRLGIRPEDIVFASGENTVNVSVVEKMGNENYIYADLGDQDLTARTENNFKPESGEEVTFSFEEKALYLFDSETGESLKTKTETSAIETGLDEQLN